MRALRHGLIFGGLAVAFGGAAIAQAPAAPAPQGEITVTGRGAASETPLVGSPDFISPMGEPVHSHDKLSGAEHWFEQADADHSGHLTLAEFSDEAARFFATLDTDRNGYIGPAEVDHYEGVVAPEVQVVSTYGDPSKITQDSDGKLVDPPYPTRLGAGRFGYLAVPEPIVSADSNLDRAVTRAEFQEAANKRFKMLDRNGDGAITRDELPRLESPSRGEGR